MIIKGIYNEAKVYTEIIEDSAIAQIQAMCDNPAFAGRQIRIMPDVHSGAGCTIGTTMTVTDKIVPNMVGVDIGCGMEVVILDDEQIDFARLDALIREKIPSGMNSRKKEHAYADKIDLSKLKCFKHINARLARLSVGTLGGGNHFIEADRDDDGRLYLVVHSGSRHLGLEVANYYQKEAYAALCGRSQAQINAIIASLKAEGRDREISGAIAAAKANAAAGVTPETAYVEGALFDDYIDDMKLVQSYAVINRQAMIDEIVNGLGLTVADRFTTIHNYIDTDSMILRKGAVSARAGERLLIPVNMRDGSLLCTGKGNADWNYSAPHGAGRLMSRGKAFATLDVEEFARQMEGIYSTSVGRNTLDESPMAYKSMTDIVGNIADTVTVDKVITPVYNFKAGEEPAPWSRRR